jgi:TetR/AcrR family transcriptional regulator, repressor of fatR-cypB operon
MNVLMAPKTQGRAVEKVEKVEKKDAILAAMLDLIVERGLHDAPMSMLAKRSGASPGVIYHYFPSKDDLIHAVYERVSLVKRGAILSGYSETMTPREAFLQTWLNAYRFYRTHLKETRFLDQYLNSPYCRPASGEDASEPDSIAAKFLKLSKPRKQGGLMKDLPVEAIYSLSFGLAASLAKTDKTFSAATLKRVAEAAWVAIVEA